MHDLPGDQFGQQRLPLVALGMGTDLAGERLIAKQEALRQVEQRLPELVLDPRGAVSVLEVLRREILAQRIGVSVDMEHGLEARRRSSRVALGKPAELGEHAGVHRQRIVGWKAGEPTLDGLGVGERVLDRLAESEHRGRRAVAGTVLARNQSSTAIGPGTNGQLRWKSLFRKRDDGPK